MWHLTLLHAPSPGTGRPGFLQSGRCEIQSHCWFAVHLSPWGEHVLLSWLVFQVFSPWTELEVDSCTISSCEYVSSWDSVFKVHPHWSMGSEYPSARRLTHNHCVSMPHFAYSFIWVVSTVSNANTPMSIKYLPRPCFPSFMCVPRGLYHELTV